MEVVVFFNARKFPYRIQNLVHLLRGRRRLADLVVPYPPGIPVLIPG